MSVLFTTAYDIIPGKEDEYANFIAGTYLKELAATGLTPVGGYYVEVGFGPRVIGVNLATDLELLSRVITSERFKQLSLNVKSLVYSYRTTVLEPTGRVKRETYTIQKGVWKFNQYYDLKPGVKKEYADFIVKEYLPTIQKIDYMEVTGGWNVVLGGVSEIVSEFTFKDPVDIGRLLNNEEFRKLNLKLKGKYVLNYASRVLRCTERFDEPRWFRL
ncbi:MAG TPA: hypothetical protein VMT71_01180 [Syntrophorhabdales bacterium]|nr:hypothetical protein [Syntrophorhabdales bacterium]